MAWNEPGGSGKDPWSGKGGDQGPPELDEVVRKLQEKLGGLFGGGKRPSGGGAGRGGGLGSGGAAPSPKVLVVAGAILLVIWLATGIYIIEPAQRGVELRFGAYSRMTEPGPHWRFPYPIEDVVKVNVDELSSFRHKAEMLTKDENIVDVELTVQSRIGDAAAYLFQDQSPEKTMRDATETVVRETIGQSKLDYILTEGRSSIAQTIKERTQALLNQYKTGLEVTSINMQPAKPPDQVKESFDDAIKAREDKERLENKAEAYANEVLPRARGEAARAVADATAYRDKVIAEAEGETARFSAVLAEYEKAPAVTRERLYLDAVQQVLSDAQLLLLDAKGSSNLMYLPLERLMRPAAASEGGQEQAQTQAAIAPGPSTTLPTREVDRSRRSR